MPELIRIDDPADPLIAAYCDIRERDLVGRQGLFIAEGRTVLQVLVAAPRFRIRSVLLLENRVAGLADLLPRMPDATPVYVASRSVIDAIAGFPMHRGVLALAERAVDEPAATILGNLLARAVVVAAIGIANHDNIGAIFRNAAAFGAAAVLLDETCCDPLYRKALRVSVGGVLKTPFARGGSGEALVSALQQHGFDILALSPAGATPLTGIERRERMALLLGAEGPGLPATLLARLRNVSIPMAGGFDSLNVATAGAIALY